MYGYKHPRVEHSDKIIRILNTKTNQVLRYDDNARLLKVETDKKIIKFILDGEKSEE